MAMQFTEVYDWDMTEVEDAQSYETVVLPAGKYPFTVVKLTREYFEGSANAPEGPRARLQLEIDGGEKGKGVAFERILLNKKSAWRIATLFASCGFGVNAQGHRIIDWDAIEGKSGIATFRIHEYQGKESNEVDKFLSEKAEPARQAGGNAWA